MSYSAVHHQGAKQNVLASLLGRSHVPNHYIQSKDAVFMAILQWVNM